MGLGQMLRVSMVDGWPKRPRGTEPARPGMRAQGARAQDHCVIIRSHGGDCRRSAGDQQPGVSGPSPGRPALCLHLAVIPPGAPHLAVNGGDVTRSRSSRAPIWRISRALS